MCWLKQTDTASPLPEALIAEYDIPIFKICHRDKYGTIRSYYNCFLYTLGVLYKLEDKLEIDKTGIDIGGKIRLYLYITKGFHSYSKECKIDVDIYYNIILELLNKCQEYYPNCSYYPRIATIVVEGHISKGASYYINDRGEYVSDRIILDKVIE